MKRLHEDSLAALLNDFPEAYSSACGECVYQARLFTLKYEPAYKRPAMQETANIEFGNVCFVENNSNSN